VGSKFKIGTVEKKILLAGWDRQRDQFANQITRNYNISLSTYTHFIKKGLITEGKRQNNFLLTDLGRLYCLFEIVKRKRKSLEEAEEQLEVYKQWGIRENIIDPDTTGKNGLLRHKDNWRA